MLLILHNRDMCAMLIFDGTPPVVGAHRFCG
jgi:hypothetical protein